MGQLQAFYSHRSANASGLIHPYLFLLEHSYLPLFTCCLWLFLFYNNIIKLLQRFVTLQTLTYLLLFREKQVGSLAPDQQFLLVRSSNQQRYRELHIPRPPRISGQ